MAVDGPDTDAGLARHVGDLRLGTLGGHQASRCRDDEIAVAPRVGAEGERIGHAGSHELVKIRLDKRNVNSV